MIPQVLQRKQSICHPLPADRLSVYPSRKVTIIVVETYQAPKLSPPRVSEYKLQSLALRSRAGGGLAEK